MELIRSNETPHEGNTCDDRFQCNVCRTTFCAACKSSPYHSGFTCKQFELLQSMQQCRFCQSQILNKKVDSCTNVCSAPECQVKRSMSCNKILRCGHYCGGIKSEETCLHCLHPQCAASQATSHCAICQVDRLEAAPCIELRCGHIFHLECVRRQIRNRWTGPRISFRFMECALCKEQIQHPVLSDILRPMQELYQQIKEKAVRRLGLLAITAPADGSSKEEYAMLRAAYFMCYQCKQPYFGGENVCEEERAAYDPQELLCGWCSTQGPDSQPCNKHGPEFLEYKCRYCCAPSVFFCWGTSHFCESCHNKAGMLALLPRDQLPKCTCNVDHPPNGEEFCMGCLGCKNEL